MIVQKQAQYYTNPEQLMQEATTAGQKLKEETSAFRAATRSLADDEATAKLFMAWIRTTRALRAWTLNKGDQMWDGKIEHVMRYSVFCRTAVLDARKAIFDEKRLDGVQLELANGLKVADSKLLRAMSELLAPAWDRVIDPDHPRRVSVFIKREGWLSSIGSLPKLLQFTWVDMTVIGKTLAVDPDAILSSSKLDGYQDALENALRSVFLAWPQIRDMKEAGEVKRLINLQAECVSQTAYSPYLSPHKKTRGYRENERKVRQRFANLLGWYKLVASCVETRPPARAVVQVAQDPLPPSPPSEVIRELSSFMEKALRWVGENGVVTPADLASRVTNMVRRIEVATGQLEATMAVSETRQQPAAERDRDEVALRALQDNFMGWVTLRRENENSDQRDADMSKYDQFRFLVANRLVRDKMRQFLAFASASTSSFGHPERWWSPLVARMETSEQVESEAWAMRELVPWRHIANWLARELSEAARMSSAFLKGQVGRADLLFQQEVVLRLTELAREQAEEQADEVRDNPSHLSQVDIDNAVENGQNMLNAISRQVQTTAQSKLLNTLDPDLIQIYRKQEKQLAGLAKVLEQWAQAMGQNRSLKMAQLERKKALSGLAASLRTIGNLLESLSKEDVPGLWSKEVNPSKLDALVRRMTASSNAPNQEGAEKGVDAVIEELGNMADWTSQVDQLSFSLEEYDRSNPHHLNNVIKYIEEMTKRWQNLRPSLGDLEAPAQLRAHRFAIQAARTHASAAFETIRKKMPVTLQLSMKQAMDAFGNAARELEGNVASILQRREKNDMISDRVGGTRTALEEEEDGDLQEGDGNDEGMEKGDEIGEEEDDVAVFGSEISFDNFGDGPSTNTPGVIKSYKEIGNTMQRSKTEEVKPWIQTDRRKQLPGMNALLTRVVPDQSKSKGKKNKGKGKDERGKESDQEPLLAAISELEAARDPLLTMLLRLATSYQWHSLRNPREKLEALSKEMKKLYIRPLADANERLQALPPEEMKRRAFSAVMYRVQLMQQAVKEVVDLVDQSARNRHDRDADQATGIADKTTGSLSGDVDHLKQTVRSLNEQGEYAGDGGWRLASSFALATQALLAESRAKGLGGTTEESYRNMARKYSVMAQRVAGLTYFVQEGRTRAWKVAMKQDVDLAIEIFRDTESSVQHRNALKALKYSLDHPQARPLHQLILSIGRATHRLSGALEQHGTGSGEPDLTKAFLAVTEAWLKFDKALDTPHRFGRSQDISSMKTLVKAVDNTLNYMLTLPPNSNTVISALFRRHWVAVRPIVDRAISKVSEEADMIPADSLERQSLQCLYDVRRTYRLPGILHRFEERHPLDVTLPPSSDLSIQDMSASVLRDLEDRNLFLPPPPLSQWVEAFVDQTVRFTQTLHSRRHDGRLRNDRSSTNSKDKLISDAQGMIRLCYDLTWKLELDWEVGGDPTLRDVSQLLSEVRRSLHMFSAYLVIAADKEIAGVLKNSYRLMTSIVGRTERIFNSLASIEPGDHLPSSAEADRLTPLMQRTDEFIRLAESKGTREDDFQELVSEIRNNIAKQKYKQDTPFTSEQIVFYYLALTRATHATSRLMRAMSSTAPKIGFQRVQRDALEALVESFQQVAQSGGSISAILPARSWAKRLGRLYVHIRNNMEIIKETTGKEVTISIIQTCLLQLTRDFEYMLETQDTTGLRLHQLEQIGNRIASAAGEIYREKIPPKDAGALQHAVTGLAQTLDQVRLMRNNDLSTVENEFNSDQSTQAKLNSLLISLWRQNSVYSGIWSLNSSLEEVGVKSEDLKNEVTAWKKASEGLGPWFNGLRAVHESLEGKMKPMTPEEFDASLEKIYNELES